MRQTNLTLKLSSPVLLLLTWLPLIPTYLWHALLHFDIFSCTIKDNEYQIVIVIKRLKIKITKVLSMQC